MVSRVDGSKVTRRFWRTGGAIVPMSRNASGASNPTLSSGKNDYRTTGNTGNSTGGSAMRDIGANPNAVDWKNDYRTAGNTGNTGNSPSGPQCDMSTLHELFSGRELQLSRAISKP